MTTTDPAPLPIRSPADLVAAVASLLGTHPTESLVLVGVTEEKLSAIVVVDLGAIALPGIVAALFGAVRRSFAAGVVALVYTETTVRTGLLAEPFAAAATGVGLELLASLVVTANQIRPLDAEPTPPGSVVQMRPRVSVDPNS